ncbi:hypothetical protein KEM60_01612 [Austwickia sp. TVS 96-490-7B]|uniref:TIGR03086 family metal-binding protein n=1 Tax=Austwickia sp. TVS 96-490-7B TaxID=2830843 RepID=UPI001C569704|nr:TIGR03086 family metal-binding protein [Austwickia sp. TVS 96-490-7B]MBW3085412.1 hypothetical protein [Austwickia sp. TVS 96-490-7B]
MSLPHVLTLLPEAARAVTAVVESVTDHDWYAPSPCQGWRVGDVLNHLVAEHLWAPHLLRGETLEQVGQQYDGDVLGTDLPGAWKRAMTFSLMAWAQADPDGQVHTRGGLLPVRDYAHQMLLDLTVHGWDLAAGAGVNYEPVADAVEAGIAYERPRVAAGQTSSLFAPPVPYAGDHRLGMLLSLTGRRPFRRG